MDNRDMFVMYFAGLVSMQYHPRNRDSVSGEYPPIDLEKFADIAADMVDITNGIWHVRFNVPPIFEHGQNMGGS